MSKLRNDLLSIVLTTLLCACSTPIGTSNTEQATQEKAATETVPALIPVRACYSSKSSTQAAIWYALDRGLFEKYGLKVDLVSLGGGAKAAAALIAKDVDICTMAASSVVSAVVAGEDLVMTAGFYDKYPYFLIVSTDISKPQDLEHKKVAFGPIGSSQESATRVGVRALGLEPDKDVELVAFTEESERVAAFEAGHVSGVIVFPPMNFRLTEKGYKVLLDMSTLDLVYQGAGVVTRRSFIQQNRDVVLRFNKAIIEAIELMKRDPQSTKEVIAKFLGFDLTKDQKVLDETYSLLISKNLLEKPYPSSVGIQNVIDESALQNPQAVNYKAGDMVDLSIIDELEASGFLNSLYNK
jgi:ABC-type nitrate/sulfonate/bicarbonate transport system substrate-binding protein